MDNRNLKLTALQIKTLTYFYGIKEADKVELTKTGHSTRPLSILFAHGLIGHRNNFGTDLYSITHKGVLYIDKLKELTYAATKQSIPEQYRDKNRLLERLGRDTAVLLNIR